MLPLLAILREWREHPVQGLLTLVGVAIGVAVVVAVDVSSVSAEREFQRANRALQGVATHRVSGATGGIDEQIFTLVKVRAGIRDAAPVVRGSVTAGGETLELMGVDPVSDYRLRGMRLDPGDAEPRPFPVFAAAALADRLGLAVGDTLTLAYGRRTRDFHLAGTLNADAGAALPANVLVTDIAAAQVFLGSAGRLSFVDVRLDDEDEAEALRSLLPPGVNLVDTQTRNRAQFAMTRAFRTNLTALGLLALVIGLFLIYNTVSFQVVRRRPLFGLLRALGMTGNGLFAWLLAEAAVIAAVGVTLGVALGVFLSGFLYAMVSGTIDALYFDLAGSALTLAPITLAKAALLGAGATVFAAAIPALEARRAPPRGLFTRSSQETAALHSRRWLGAAGAAIAAALLVLWLNEDSLVAAFAALFLLILGAAALAPALVWTLSRGMEAAAARMERPGVVMAVRNVRAHLSRTGVATAALSVAVAATLGVALMIGSFRTSVEDWLRGYLRADIYISTPATDAPAFTDAFIASLRHLEGVDSIALGRRLTVDDPRHGPVEIFVLDTTPEGFAGFQVKAGDREKLFERFRSGGAVLVTEPFANRFDLAPGDTFELATDRGPRGFDVAAVYTDYSTERGVMTLSPHTFERHFDPRGYRAASLYLAEGFDVERVMAAFNRSLNRDDTLYARSNRTLREASLAIFDRTFRVTGILRLLAVVVAVTGIVSALMALQLERAREFATLRALGFTPAQIGGQVLGETTLTGLAAGLLALPIGLALCVLLIRVINLRSFGWTMQTVIDPFVVGQSLALAVGAALAAGLYPAWRLRRFAVADNLRGD